MRDAFVGQVTVNAASSDRDTILEVDVDPDLQNSIVVPNSHFVAPVAPIVAAPLKTVFCSTILPLLLYCETKETREHRTNWAATVYYSANNLHTRIRRSVVNKYRAVAAQTLRLRFTLVWQYSS